MSITIPGLNGKQFKIKLSKLFFPLLIFAVVVIVFVKFSELQEIGQVFVQAKWYWLLAAFVCQIINFSLQGAVYYTSFRLLKFPPFNFLKLIKSTLTIIFLNYTIPSLSFAGNIWFLKILKKQGLKEGKGLMVVILEFVCFYLAFIVLLAIAFLYLFFKLGYIGLSQQIAVIGFFAILLFVIFMFYFWLGNKSKASQRAVWLAKKFYQVEPGETVQERVDNLLKDFYQDFAWLKKNKIKLLIPTGLQFIKFLFDGLVIYFLFLAFGLVPLFGLAVVAFAFGRLFGLASFIPGGVGAFEGAMVLIFNSLGLSLESALAVMLVYRFFSYWLYFPLGLIFYRQFDKS